MRQLFLPIVALIASVAAFAFVACQPLTAPQQQGISSIAQTPADVAASLHQAAVDVRATTPTTQGASIAASLDKAAAAVEKGTPVAEAVAGAATQPGASPVTVILGGAQAGAEAAASGVFGPQATGYGLIALLVLRMVQAEIHKKQNASTPVSK